MEAFVLWRGKSKRLRSSKVLVLAVNLRVAGYRWLSLCKSAGYSSSSRPVAPHDNSSAHRAPNDRGSNTTLTCSPITLTLTFIRCSNALSFPLARHQSQAPELHFEHSPHFALTLFHCSASLSTLLQGNHNTAVSRKNPGRKLDAGTTQSQPRNVCGSSRSVQAGLGHYTAQFMPHLRPWVRSDGD